MRGISGGSEHATLMLSDNRDLKARTPFGCIERSAINSHHQKDFRVFGCIEHSGAVPALS